MPNTGKAAKNCNPISDKIKEELTNIIDEKFRIFNDNIKTQLEYFRKDFIDLIGIKTEEILNLQSEVALLKKKISTLEDNIDGSDAYERRDTIIISGDIPPENRGENYVELIRKTLKDKLKLELSSTDISTVHRLGKRPQTQGTKRNIIMKLCRRDIKRDIIIASRNQDRNSNRIFVNESLTPQRNTIFHTLRKIKRDHPNIISGCSTFDGKVIAFTKPSPTAPRTARDIRHVINNRETFEKFCSEYIKLPLENFIQTWPHF